MSEKKLYKIKEKPDLARDVSSNAIINTNETALEKAKAAKHRRKQLVERVDSLEEKVDLILEILQKDNN